VSAAAHLGERTADGSAGNVGYRTFVDWKRRTHSFDDMVVIRSWKPTLVSGDEPERLTGLRVSWNYFRMLGTAPALGRDFREDERTPPRGRAYCSSATVSGAAASAPIPLSSVAVC
jgi:hypothetical protein